MTHATYQREGVRNKDLPLITVCDVLEFRSIKAKLLWIQTEAELCVRDKIRKILGLF